MKKLLFIMLLALPLLMACSSDDGEEDSRLTFQELYTGDYEWAGEDDWAVIRFLDANKMYFWQSGMSVIWNCSYNIKTDDSGNLSFEFVVCGTGDDWEYFSTKDETLRWKFKWCDSSHTSFKLDEMKLTKLLPKEL